MICSLRDTCALNGSVVCLNCNGSEIRYKPKETPMNEAKIERISEIVHIAYCKQYKIKHGKDYWTGSDYSKLDEETKEFDRATVRAVLQALAEPKKPVCGTIDSACYGGTTKHVIACPTCKPKVDVAEFVVDIRQTAQSLIRHNRRYAPSDSCIASLFNEAADIIESMEA